MSRPGAQVGQDLHVTALIRLSPASRAPQSSLRSLVRAMRRASELPGFRAWQTFRAMDTSDSLLVIVDWDSEATLEAALRDPQIAALQQRARELELAGGPVQCLDASFDRRLSPQAGAATLLRLSVTDSPCPGGPSRENDLALRALAAPDSLRVQSAQDAAGTVTTCRIDFDTEDGLWHFLDSPLRRTWSRWCEHGYENETWAINLPRLERQRPASRGAAGARALPPLSTLCVYFELGDDGESAFLKLQGRVDSHGSAHCERLCETLLESGCLRLKVDVSGLSHISPDALGMLARTARHLKGQGGQFILVDNEERVKRVTRSKHLEASVR